MMGFFLNDWVLNCGKDSSGRSSINIYSDSIFFSEEISDVFDECSLHKRETFAFQTDGRAR